MLAKTITAASVIAALYLAYHHAWSGVVIAGLAAILAARWSELSRMRHVWRIKSQTGTSVGVPPNQRLRPTWRAKGSAHRVKP